jgi:hypothetical protein
MLQAKSGGYLQPRTASARKLIAPLPRALELVVIAMPDEK